MSKKMNDKIVDELGFNFKGCKSAFVGSDGFSIIFEPDNTTKHGLLRITEALMVKGLNVGIEVKEWMGDLVVVFNGSDVALSELELSEMVTIMETAGMQRK